MEEYIRGVSWVTYTVELPNPEKEDWVYNVICNFDTREEAIKWAKENLGSDDNGNINVIGKVEI